MAGLADFLAQILNPNPGTNRLANPGGGGGGNYLTQTGLGPEQMARYQQMSGMGGGGMPQMPTAPQGAPPAMGMASQAPMMPPAQSAPMAAPSPMGGGGILGGLRSLFGGGDGGQQQQINHTVNWLTTEKGLDPGTAQALATNPKLLQDYLSDQMKPQAASDFDQRAAAAAQYGLDPNTPEGQAFILSGDMPAARGGAAEVGLTPQFGVDAEGNPAMVQLGKDAKARMAELPPGFKLQKEPIKIDLGTEFAFLDPITRQLIKTVPKDIAGAERQKLLGTKAAESEFDLPRVEDNANIMLGVLNDMRESKGRKGSTGFIEGLLPSRSGPQVEFQSLVDQTQGQAFLQAFESLKGAGQITEIEGAKATQALSRLGNQRLGDAEYLKAMDDFEAIVKIGLERAYKKSGVKPPTPGGVDESSSSGDGEAFTPAGKKFWSDPDNAKKGRVGGGGWKPAGIPGVTVRRVQ